MVVDCGSMVKVSLLKFVQVANFPKFINVVPNTSCRIGQDLNDGTKHLAFQIMGQSHIVHYIDPLTGLHFPITCDDFEVTIIVMKAQCTFAYDLLVIKLKCKFSNHELMNALGVITHNTSYNQFVSSLF
jgi:hypothetical protein